MKSKKQNQLRRSFYVQCEPTHYSVIRRNRTRTNGGPCSLACHMANLPHVEGLRYKVIFELVGADKETRPKLYHFVPQYCWHIPPKEAKKRIRKAVSAECRNYMRDVLRQWKEGKEAHKQALRVWREAQKLKLSQKFYIGGGSTFDSELDSFDDKTQ